MAIARAFPIMYTAKWAKSIQLFAILMMVSGIIIQFRLAYHRPGGYHHDNALQKEEVSWPVLTIPYYWSQSLYLKCGEEED